MYSHYERFIRALMTSTSLHEPWCWTVLHELSCWTVFSETPLRKTFTLSFFSRPESAGIWGFVTIFVWEKQVELCRLLVKQQLGRGKRKICQRMSVWENKIISMNGEKLMKYKFELVKCYSFKLCFFRF